MANKLILKKSSVAAKVPLATDLDVGELAVNLVDKKLYSKNAAGTVVNVGNVVDSVAGKTGAVTLAKADVGLSSVEDKSSATIRGEITSANVTGGLGFTPYNATNPTGYITSSGNAATATALQTARTINGVSFNGTANITVADATKLPLAGGTLTGTVNAPTFNATSTVGGGFQGIDADTAAAPSFTWTADLNTGIYRPGVDILGFTAGGVERGRVNTTGFSGNGSQLTALNASNLSSGTVPDARLTGTYTGVSITGNAATASAVAFSGVTSKPTTLSGYGITDAVQAGAGGAIIENSQSITANYTLTAGKNGLSAGPITITSGITVTVPSGSTWVIA